MGESVQIPQPNSHNESSLVRGGRENVNKSVIKKNDTSPLKGKVVKRDITFGEKIKRSFVKEDLKDIRDYIIFELVIPNARKAFFDTIVGTAAQIFGVSVPRGIRYNDGYSPNNIRLTPHERQYRDYNTISQNGSRSSTPRLTTYDRFYVNDYIFAYKEDAERVLEQIIDICDTYGWVSVAKFFEFADPEGTIAGRNAYTNNDFGWRNIDNATVRFDGSGYFIDLPPATRK